MISNINGKFRHNVTTEKLEVNKNGVWVDVATLADIPSSFTISTITSNTTVSYGVLYLVDTTLGDITLTLPTSVGNSGKSVFVTNIGNNKVKILPTLSQTINGNTEFNILYKNSYLEVLSIETNFIIR